MLLHPCAKINLGLYVTERRPDGYHNLETIFYPIPLCDELEVEASTEDRFSVSGPVLPPVSDDGHSQDAMFTDNLVTRTVHLLREEGLPVPPVAIRLQKNIPFGAGLGGGSSDAAAMMKMLNALFHLGLSDSDMEQRLARLGADCPFFVRCRPVLATGIGDQFTPVDLSLSGLWLLLVKPADFVSTREAYHGVQPQPARHRLTETIREDISTWRFAMENDFEQSIFPQHPTIAHIKQSLYDHGAAYAAMSGSGSSVFGIFRNEPSQATVEAYRPHFTFKARL